MFFCNHMAVVVLHYKIAASARELGQAVAMQHNLLNGVGNVIVVVGQYVDDRAVFALSY